MVLDPSLYKVLSWSFMGLIRSELYCLGIRIQRKKFCLFRSRANYIRLKNLIIKNQPEQNIHVLSFISKRSFICCGSLINFANVALFINCSNSKQHHYSSHAYYNLGKNLTSNKILVTYTLALTNTKWPEDNI